jgi:V/A-type H+/Na+-transporting ATPase subunit D
MTTLNPTRAALLELQEERHAMREGHVFLDEKCLLLAGEMLRQLQQHARLQARLNEASEAALRALHAAVARHGLQGLQVQPPANLEGAGVQLQASSLMGVRLQEARWVATGSAAPAAVAMAPAAGPPNVSDSPEARACRRAFAALAEAAIPLAAVGGNLERLSQEYRRSVRRARALQDVLLPALERDVAEIASSIEELEQQDAIAMRRPALGQAREPQ